LSCGYVPQKVYIYTHIHIYYKDYNQEPSAIRKEKVHMDCRSLGISTMTFMVWSDLPGVITPAHAFIEARKNPHHGKVLSSGIQRFVASQGKKYNATPVFKFDQPLESTL
jgi:hypothetical protein